MKAQRTRPHLEQLLADHRRLLSELGDHFDAGSVVMALPLAMSIRVLVHDFGQSRSLLGQMGVLRHLQFVDTALHVGASGASWGLTILVKRPHVAPSWEPPLGKLSPPRVHDPVDFERWWWEPVTKDHSGSEWSRRQLVWLLANKEGGGHVDPDRDKDLRLLEEMNTMGAVIRGDEGIVIPDRGPLLPSVRQVAWELEATLNQQVDVLLSEGAE